MLPTTHTAGDSFSASVALPGYLPSAAWVAKLRFVPRVGGGAALTLTAAAVLPDDTHLFTATAAITANWVPGAYGLSLWVERAGERTTIIPAAELQVAANPATLTAGTDLRSLPRRTLDDLLAARAVYATGALGRVQRFKIGDREREFKTAAELDSEIRFWQTQLANELAADRLAAGLRPRNKILTRFVRPR